MERQVITVDIAPGNSQVERLGASQGDIGRPMGVYIIQDGVALDCSAYSAELYILKPDGKFYTTQATVDATETNLIKWETAKQETPVAGACAAQIRITAGDDDIGTARFVEFVEASPGDMGSASESEVALLTEYVRQARESATSAGRDATTASDAASSASGSASTATAAASTATQAASAAEDAANRAEEVEESIPADYSQMSADVSELKSAFGQLNDNVITDSVGPAPIVSVTDGADGMPMREVEVAIEPVQDLHGYDYPWPAGGGKNKLQVTATAQTVNGVTFTVNEDGTISCSGNATETIIFNVCRWTGTSGTEYILNGCPSGGSGSTFKLDYNNSPFVIDNGSGISFTASGNEGMVRIVIYAGYGNGLVFKPMIRLATETDATFAPYSNICPISGRTVAKVTRTGRNLFGGEINQLAFVLKYPGSAIVSGQKYKGIYASVEAGKTYTISRKTIEGNRFRVSASVETPADNIPCIILSNGSENDSKYAVTVTVPSGYNYIFVYLSNQSDTCTSGNYMIELGSTVSAYEAPSIQSVTIPFGQTVYGGTLDVTAGVLTVDRALTDLGAQSWQRTAVSYGYYFVATISDNRKASGDILCSAYKFVGYGAAALAQQNCTISRSSTNKNVFVRDDSYSTVEDFKTAVSGVQLCYYLEEPISIQLDPVVVLSLLGENHLFADAGNTAVTYPADTKMYIDRKITEAVANALNA